jgi:CRP/FNR family transcriptional regulator, cyclic AMP receptor protein
MQQQSTAETIVKDAKCIRIFAQLKPEQLAMALECLEYAYIPANKTLFKIGNPGDEIYFIARGRITFTTPSASPNEDHNLETIGPGTIFGEVAFFDKQKRTANAVVVEEFFGFILSRKNAARFFEVCPQAYEEIIKTMARRLSRSSEQMSSMYISIGDVIAANRTPTQARIDAVANFFGSIPFLLIMTFLL